MITVLFICLVIFIGNVLPRRLAKVRAEKCVFYLYGVLYHSYRMLKPIIFLINGLTKLAFWILRIKEDGDEENVTEDEIISIVNEGYEQGVLEDSEAEMISNIIEFDEKEVMDIMTHRKKVVSIDASLTVEEAMQFAMQQQYSRFFSSSSLTSTSIRRVSRKIRFRHSHRLTAYRSSALGAAVFDVDGVQFFPQSPLAVHPHCTQPPAF